MYYSSGNYEAFARPQKPEGVDHKSAYIIGTGLAALTAACYLVRDGQMKGDHVHILEKEPIPGGACDGWQYPDVVPEGAVNFAFLGQFAETRRDTIFTTEYSMRTGMEAVYTLLNVDRGVPEGWGSAYDIRDLLNATVQLRDGKPLTEMELGFKEKMVVSKLLKKIQGTDIEKLLKQYRVIA